MSDDFDMSVDNTEYDTSTFDDTNEEVSEIPDDVPEDEPEMTEEDDLSDDIPEDVPEDEPEISEDNDLSDDIPEDVPEDEPEMTEEDDLSDDIPEDVPEDELEMAEEEDLSNDIPEDVPEDEPEMAEEDDLSDDIPEDVPEDEPEMAEDNDLSDDVPENVPEEQEEIEDTSSDVDSDNSAEPAEDTQDEPLDDTAADEVSEETTSETEDTDAAEQVADTQDEPLDDTATNEVSEEATSETEDTDATEQISDTQDEPLDDTATDEVSEETTSETEDADVPSESDDYSDGAPYEAVEDDAETDDIDADDIQEELEDIPEDQSTDIDSGDDLSDNLQGDLPEDISSDAFTDESNEDDIVSRILEDVGDNEQSTDDQIYVTDDITADETAETPTDTETDEQPVGDQVDMTANTTADETKEDNMAIDSEEYPAENDSQLHRKALSTTPNEMSESWLGVDPKSMPQNESTQFDKKLNELMEGDLPSEKKKQILEELKEDIQTRNEFMTSETNDGRDDGAPVKVLKKDGGDTSTSHHDYEKELADLDEGIKNWGLMQENIARDLAADDERILKDDSLSEIEKQEQLALNEQKRQLLSQQYDAELSELQREREASAAKVYGNSTQRGGTSSPTRTHSNQKVADGSERGGDDCDIQARSALRPSDAAFASEDTRSPLRDSKNINRQQLANYNQAGVNDSLPYEKNNMMETNNRLCDIEMQNGLKLEDFSKIEFEKLQIDNPMVANKLMTEFVDRKTPAVDVNAPPLTENGRELRLTDSTYAITDEPCSEESASMKDLSTGKEYTVYPNPLSRISPYDIKQGNNSLGMEQDCGLASGSEAINGLYGKRIASEEFNTSLANKLENFEYAYKPLRDNEGKIMRNEFGEPLLSDKIDWENSGGTNEQNVKRMFDSYNISSDVFSGMRTPNPEYLAESLKSGDNVIAAVNSDLFWHKGDPRDNPEFLSGMSDSDAQLWKEGKCYADHFVNVYAACYDKNTGDLAGFMVKDTGAGRDGMVPLDYFKRAFNGDDRFTIMAQGCVVGRKGDSK